MGLGGAADAQARRAFGWRAAEGCYCAGPDQTSGHHPRRRADGNLDSRTGAEVLGLLKESGPLRADHTNGDPRPARRGYRRPGRLPLRRQGGGRGQGPRPGRDPGAHQDARIGRMMPVYQFVQMDDDDAREISRWHYLTSLRLLRRDERPRRSGRTPVDPARREDSYFSAFDAEGALVGFFQFEREGETVDVGLGLRPDLTGKGLGREYLLAGLEFAGSACLPGDSRFRSPPSTSVPSRSTSVPASGGAPCTRTTPTAPIFPSSRWPGKREAPALLRPQLPESAGQGAADPAHGRRHRAGGWYRVRSPHPLQYHVRHLQKPLHQGLRVCPISRSRPPAVAEGSTRTWSRRCATTRGWNRGPPLFVLFSLILEKKKALPEVRSMRLFGVEPNRRGSRRASS